MYNIKHIKDFDSFLSESHGFEFKDEDSYQKSSSIHKFDIDDLTDETSGITFKHGKYKVAYIQPDMGQYKNWNFAIYSNGTEIMVHGNPSNGQGEVFSVIKGDFSTAEKIANALSNAGKLIRI